MVNFQKNRKLLLIGILVVLIAIIFLVVIPVAIVASKNKDNGGNGNGKKPFDPNSLPSDEKARINCFLEEESKFENLTQYACEQRGCIFKPSEYERVPTCFFDMKKLGYLLASQQPDIGEYNLKLKQNAKLPYISAIQNLRLSVEYLGNSIVHVKVKLNCLI